MRKDNQYFQCVAKLYLPENYTFHTLTINYLPSESYADVVSEVALRALKEIHLNAYAAVAHFESLESPYILLHLSDGSLRFSLDGPETAYDYDSPEAIVVRSKIAPVTIESSVPIDVSMSSGVAARALIKGFGVSVTRNMDDEDSDFQNSEIDENDDVSVLTQRVQ